MRGRWHLLRATFELHVVTGATVSRLSGYTKYSIEVVLWQRNVSFYVVVEANDVAVARCFDEFRDSKCNNPE